MAHPRAILPGATYLVSRRTILRHMLLRPDAEMTQLLMYSLIMAARRYEIQVHAFCALSTHIHLVVTDPNCHLPQFLAFFHRLVALGTKSLRAWDGPVWDHEPTSVVALLTRQAIVEKIAYTLVNPVAAALVRYAHEWPGAKSNAADIGKGVIRAKRPRAYFDPTNPEWVDEAKLAVSIPPSIAADDADEFRVEVAAELARQETQARRVKSHAPVLGPKRAKVVSPYGRATNSEPLRKRNPTFAVGTSNTKAWQQAARAVKAFRRAYRDALNQWLDGWRSIVFPAGTYWMRVFHRANVELCTA